MTDASSLSKQPRFSEDEVNYIFTSVYRWVKMADIEEPDYGANSRARDAWLQRFWIREPHLAGVLNSVVAIDKNRGWTLTGGRNQVRRYTDILHEVEDYSGWRTFMSMESLSFYTSDVGSITEIGRDGLGGPMRSLFHVDPARVRLSGNPSTPLLYYPRLGSPQFWQRDDFFRVVSMPSTNETFSRLGFCALSRVLELAKLMIAIYQHDQEKLLARAPRGILLLQNISQHQWNAAMNERAEKLDGNEQKYYGAVAVLASEGIEQNDAKLIALSSLPEGFDRKTFVDLLMYGYALCFGYDPSEFWPVQFGSLGRGTESQVQHMKATGKGGLDFALGYQEKLQGQLPETLHFEFEQRDAEGEMIDADVAKAKVDAVRTAYESGLTLGAPLISREEARSLLADMGFIPPEWTEVEEEAVATDTEDADQIESEVIEEAAEDLGEAERRRQRDRLLSDPYIVRTIATFPQEPIVRYRWPENRTVILASSGSDLVRRQSYPVVKVRQGEILFESEDVVITEEDVDQAIEEGIARTGEIFGELLTADLYEEETGA